MTNHYRKNKKQRKKLNLFCRILVLCPVIFCGAAFGHMISDKSKVDPPQSKSEAPSQKKAVNFLGTQQSDTGTGISGESKWNLLLVNAQNQIPDSFSVEVSSLENGHAIDKRVYSSLQEMLYAARAEGLSPLICSSYRTNAKQESLFNNQVNQYLAKGYSKEDAALETASWVAAPGTSEHQTGLAVDIVASNYQILDEKQEDTAEQKWLMENSYKYGFILRYPLEKRNITGVNYEPWHYRYVGKDAAEKIYTKKICLEEYLENRN